MDKIKILGKLSTCINCNVNRFGDLVETRVLLRNLAKDDEDKSDGIIDLNFNHAINIYNTEYSTTYLDITLRNKDIENIYPNELMKKRFTIFVKTFNTDEVFLAKHLHVQQCVYDNFGITIKLRSDESSEILLPNDSVNELSNIIEKITDTYYENNCEVLDLIGISIAED